MEKQIPAAFTIIGAALVGAIVFWVIFYFAASWLDPGGPYAVTDRALNFAATFGLAGGAVIGYEQAGKIVGEDKGMAMVVPGLLIAAAWLFGLWLLFFEGAWQVIFSGDFSGASVVIIVWLVILVWLSRALGGSFNPFRS